MKKKLVHHHLLYQSKVGVQPDSIGEEELSEFMTKLLEVLDMTCLIEPRLKLSHQNAWTGIMGIVTSHIAFHYWVDEQYVQLDIYSCKKFDTVKALKFIKEFWKAENVKALFIDREVGKDFQIKDVGK
jgi:S-adenosylmethionine decarboxylase